jgi:hypothetical protein
MARFTVTPATLQNASRLLSTGSTMTGATPAAGAAGDTPAAGAWSEFAQAVEQIHRDVYTAMEGLSSTTAVAARAYQIADDSARCSLEPN